MGGACGAFSRGSGAARIDPASFTPKEVAAMIATLRAGDLKSEESRI
jgi:hypothetical protein